MLYFHKCGSFLLGDLNLLVLRRSDKPQGCRLARERAVLSLLDVNFGMKSANRPARRKERNKFNTSSIPACTERLLSVERLAALKLP